MKNFLILTIAFLALTIITESKKKVVCYHGSWSVYRPGNGKFEIENIDPSLCTHLIFGFAGLDEFTNQIKVLDPWYELEDNYGRNAYKRFTNLSKSNPELKTLIAVGGWNEGSVKYSKMAADPVARRIFINSVIAFLYKYNFNGLDLDWEYPNSRGGVPEDKKNFAILLKELREEFDKHGFLLTAAVSAGKATMDSAYDIPALAKYLDFINVMAYDFHGQWEHYTGHNAPLNARPEESLEHQLLTANFSINYWIQNGASPDKLIMGMGLYGRSFTLASPMMNGPGAPTLGGGNPGPYTREKGTLGYNEICENLPHWTVVQDPFYKAPYAYSYNQWVGYDDPASIKVKSDFIKSMNLGGGMVWSVETDDFLGVCHGTKYPLLKVINNVLNGDGTNPIIPQQHLTSPLPIIDWTSNSIEGEGSNKDEVTQKTDKTDKTDTVTEPPPKPHPFCQDEGYVRDVHDCTKFYYCRKSGDSFIVSHYRCYDGLVFDSKIGGCNWPKYVPECNIYRFYLNNFLFPPQPFFFKRR